MFFSGLSLPQQKKQNRGFSFPVEASQKTIPLETLQELSIVKKLTKQQETELSYILYSVLSYPSLHESDVHYAANRLGGFDIKDDKLLQSQNLKNKESTNKISNSGLDLQNTKEYCKCCGFVKQTQTLSLCVPFKQFPTVGISAYSFFENIRNMIYLLLLLLLIIGGFSFGTNFYISRIYESTFSPTGFSNDDLALIFQSISIGSKKLSTSDDARLFYLIQMWMGVGLVILWSLALCLMKYYQQKSEAMVDRTTISAADFSIIIQNYPKSIRQSQLQSFLNSYHKQITSKADNDEKDISMKVQKINMHEHRDNNEQEQQQLKKINEKYQDALEEVAEWVMAFKDNGFSLPQEKRYAHYKIIDELKQQRKNQAKKILSALAFSLDTGQKRGSIFLPNEEKKDERRFAIVTFKYSLAKDFMIKYNQMNAVDTIRYYLSFCRSKNKFRLYHSSVQPNQDPEEYRGLTIYKAPEPQDILWDNLETTLCQKIVRKAITYFFTVVLLGISFGSVYFLTIQQLKNEQNFYISILISVSIAVINGAISFLIAFLTHFQGNYTQTGHQTSLAIKSIVAQLINSILFPVIANYLIEDKNIYGKNGLTTDVMYLAVTNSLLSPIIRIFDPNYRIWSIKACYFRNSQKQKLLMKQTELNLKQELPRFEIGYEYIFFINLYLFTAFFISLQPGICVVALIGMGFGYWVLKYCLLYRLKRPVPGTDIISNAMNQFIAFGPIFYELGNLTWSHFLQEHKQTEQQIFFYIPNLVGIGIAALFFIFPFTIICSRFFEQISQQSLEFQSCRILLNSEYDRMNPATMQAAIKQYEEFIQKYIEDMSSNKNISQQNKQRITQYQKTFLSKNGSKLNKKFDKKEDFFKDRKKLYPQARYDESNDVQEADERNYESLNTNFETQENLHENDEHSFSNLMLGDRGKGKIDKQFLARKKNMIQNKPSKGKNVVNNILQDCCLQKQVLSSLMSLNLPPQNSQQSTSKKFDFHQLTQQKQNEKLEQEEGKDMRQTKLDQYFSKLDQTKKQNKKASPKFDYKFPHENARIEEQSEEAEGNTRGIEDEFENGDKSRRTKIDPIDYFGAEGNVIKAVDHKSRRKNRYQYHSPYDSAF